MKSLEFRNSKATCNSKTFDFTHWGTFSAQNSEVFVQTNFFSCFQKWPYKSKNLFSKNFGNSKNPQNSFKNTWTPAFHDKKDFWNFWLLKKVSLHKIFKKKFQKFQNLPKNYFWAENKMMGPDKSGKFCCNLKFCPWGRELTFENFFRGTFLKNQGVVKNSKYSVWTNTSEFRAEKVPQ